ncbi:MAG: hypothetical protein AAF827_05080 [Cyanobacteria bacterium P01_D01_bin.6]
MPKGLYATLRRENSFPRHPSGRSPLPQQTGILKGKDTTRQPCPITADRMLLAALRDRLENKVPGQDCGRVDG